MLAIEKRKIKRTVFRTNDKAIKKYAARIASNGIQTGHSAAVKFIQDCFIAVKGTETRSLSDTEASVLVRQGFN